MIAISGHVPPLTDRVTDLQVSLHHHFGTIIDVLILSIEDALWTEQIYPICLFIKLKDIKGENLLQHQSHILLLLQSLIDNVGNQHDDH